MLLFELRACQSASSETASSSATSHNARSDQMTNARDTGVGICIWRCCVSTAINTDLDPVKIRRKSLYSNSCDTSCRETGASAWWSDFSFPPVTASENTRPVRPLCDRAAPPDWLPGCTLQSRRASDLENPRRHIMTSDTDALCAKLTCTHSDTGHSPKSTLRPEMNHVHVTYPHSVSIVQGQLFPEADL